MHASADTKLPRDEFLSDAQLYRRELVAHCYRMIGSVHDAEDLVQETYLRAWRGWEAFEGRSSVRTWLYRIATNLCLTALHHTSRRVLPAGLGPPSADPNVPMQAVTSEMLWIEPFPNTVYETASGDPAEIVESRSGLRLALVASLQHLPPRQRAVFLLREVLAYPAAEVADMLDTTVPAVKSALQRARATLDEVAPNAEILTEPDSAVARRILDRYMAAFERADIAALTELLRSDATLEVVPMRTWLSGNKTCVPYLARHVLTSPGLYRMYPTIANGQPAAAAYRREDISQPFTAFGVAVLSIDARHITAITTFIDASLVERFGFPAHI
ncbi:MAG: polymerase sigma factor [Frankiales bacterium]|nr:polymerase sigma factor [Frankiales bacterium]